MDYIQLLDGTKISTKSGEVIGEVVRVQENKEASALLSVDAEFASFRDGAIKRSIDDIDIDHKTFRVLLALFAANAWGLRVTDIARLFDAEVDDINALLEDEKYLELGEQVFASLKAAMRESVEGVLMDSAYSAALVLRQQLTVNSLDARRQSAKDILDRTGFKAADVVNVKMDDEFVIKYVEEKPHKEIDL